MTQPGAARPSVTDSVTSIDNPRYTLQNEKMIYKLLGKPLIDKFFQQVERGNIEKEQIKKIAIRMKAGVVTTFNEESLTQTVNQVS